MRLDDFLAPRGANKQPLTPVDFLWRAAAAHPKKTAIIDGDRLLTWQETADLVRRFAGALREHGIRVGDVVSVIAPNCMEMLTAHYAVPMSGGVLNCISARYEVDTVAYILGHSCARLLLAHHACRETVSKALQRMEHPCDVVWFLAPAGTDEVRFETFIEAGVPLAQPVITDEWHPICVNYTYGTTGPPKGVVYHHRGAYLNALGSVITLGLSHHSRYLWVFPMSYCNGGMHTWSVTAAAGTHVCLERADSLQILGLLASERITHLCCVPAVLQALVDEPAFAQLQLEQRVTIGVGGEMLSAELIARLEAQGVNLIHFYGLTESYGPAAYSPEQPDWAALTAHQKSIRLARHVSHPLGPDLELMDPEGRGLLPKDRATVGEIVLRGNTLMAGYYRDPTASEQAFVGGWFRTGDLALRRPHGPIEIRRRWREVIISGDDDIFAVEIEHVLYTHQAVLMAAVVAMPDEELGEVPCAFVELKRGVQPPSESELIEFCRAHLASHAIPKKFFFGSVPTTPTGMISKHVCRKRASIQSVVLLTFDEPQRIGVTDRPGRSALDALLGRGIQAPIDNTRSQHLRQAVNDRNVKFADGIVASLQTALQRAGVQLQYLSNTSRKLGKEGQPDDHSDIAVDKDAILEIQLGATGFVITEEPSAKLQPCVLVGATLFTGRHSTFMYGKVFNAGYDLQLPNAELLPFDPYPFSNFDDLMGKIDLAIETIVGAYTAVVSRIVKDIK